MHMLNILIKIIVNNNHLVNNNDTSEIYNEILDKVKSLFAKEFDN